MCRRNPLPFRRRRLKLNELILGIDDLRLQSGDAAIDVRDLALDSAPGEGRRAVRRPARQQSRRPQLRARPRRRRAPQLILAPEGSTFADLPAGVAVVTAKEPRRALA